MMGRSGLAWLGLVLAAGTSAHAGTTLDSLSGFRGWSEPAVRSWQQTNAEVARDSTSHDHHVHGGMDHGSMGHGDMPASPPGSALSERPNAPASSALDHQSMHHGSPSMEQTASPMPGQALPPNTDPTSARPAQAPDHDSMSHGSRHP